MRIGSRCENRIVFGPIHVYNLKIISCCLQFYYSVSEMFMFIPTAVTSYSSVGVLFYLGSTINKSMTPLS